MKKTALFLLTLATAATMTSCVKIDVQGDIEPKEPEVSMGGMMGGMQLTNPVKHMKTVKRSLRFSVSLWYRYPNRKI